MPSTIGRLAGLVSAVGIAGCLHQGVRPSGPLSGCETGDRPMIRDSLYLGRNRPDGGQVHEQEWQAFLDAVVTPRFPEGLTITSATGQWRGANGKVESEASSVVTLLHAGDAGARGKVAEIAQEYKRRFHQEAVLRERSQVCATF